MGVDVQRDKTGSLTSPLILLSSTDLAVSDDLSPTRRLPDVDPRGIPSIFPAYLNKGFRTLDLIQVLPYPLSHVHSGTTRRYPSNPLNSGSD